MMRVRAVHAAPVALLLLLTAAGPASGQRAHTAHTLTATDGMAPPAATLADAAWLEGAWEGEGLGGWNDEVWSAPLAGSMMGVFRHVLTLRRDGPEGMTVWLSLNHGESTEEAGFTYRRRSAAPAP